MSSPSSRLTLGFASVAHTYSHMFVLFFATVVLVLEREWQLPYATLFAYSIPGAILFGAGALPAGWLGDRWSASGMIAVFFLGTGAASVLTGLADGPLALAIGLALIGLFASIYHPVGIPWLVKNARSRGRALGINGVFGSLGTALAAVVAGLLADLWGWRAAFIVPGLVCMATGLAFVAAMRLGAIVDAEADVVTQPAPVAADIRRAFIALAVTVTCVGLIYQAVSYALPKVFQERLTGIDEMAGVLGIGGVVTLVYLVSGFTQLIGGELAERYRLKAVYVWCLAAQTPVYLLAMVLFSPVLIPVAALMISLNMLSQPAENALLARYTPLKWRGQVFGAKFVLTLGVSTIGLAVIPVIHAMTGSLDALFLVLFASAAIAVLAALLLPGDRWQTAPRMQPAPAGDD
jgi:MFS family permease